LAERIALLRGYEGRDPEARGPNDAPPVSRPTGRSPQASPERVAADDVEWRPEWGSDSGQGSRRRSPADPGQTSGEGPFGAAGPMGLGGPRSKGGGRPGRGARRGSLGRGGRILGGLGGSGAPPGFGGGWVGKGRPSGRSIDEQGSWPDGPWPDEADHSDHEEPPAAPVDPPGRRPESGPEDGRRD
jgi:hypothetical protein